ncbi:MAG: hypothetical protein A2W91_01150 [Bacteroidetes bacterium GWF2_38_335]|nr:MAG: hypothetical protein A2W91_01150 [Bacteroidetes bacterium GWF2_38_335]OFY80359.1 MAG: hypothetical protein A2281_17660 [Bacteroidetes bacterium RIFOXYA12_FULL_38_20]
MCKKCGEINYKKRTETADLSNYIAVITGGRIKIGYHASLKLLRSGAFVIITTRFPIDAVIRYSNENDFDNWRSRLKIYKIDFRNIFQVEEFINFINQKLPYLDILINNAAQTIQRPKEYYDNILSLEESESFSLPEYLKKLVINTIDDFDFSSYQKRIDGFVQVNDDSKTHTLPDKVQDLFPIGKHDEEGLQLDLRHNNSWISKAEDISTIEMLEVQLINVTAPFLFCSRFKNIMKKSPNPKRFIVNVSAMEGKFNRVNKNAFHPHTNMAKAALNMLTRTSAQDYKKDGIYMNSVDTGWITDENPHYIRLKNKKKSITPPLDSIDGAARVCDPIIHGLNTGNFSSGQYFKDYHLTSW